MGASSYYDIAKNKKTITKLLSGKYLFENQENMGGISSGNTSLHTFQKPNSVIKINKKASRNDNVYMTHSIKHQQEKLRSALYLPLGEIKAQNQTAGGVSLARDLVSAKNHPESTKESTGTNPFKRTTRSKASKSKGFMNLTKSRMNQIAANLHHQQ